MSEYDLVAKTKAEIEGDRQYDDGYAAGVAAERVRVRAQVEKWLADLGAEPVRSYTLDWHYWDDTGRAYRRVLDMLDQPGDGEATR